MRSFQLTILVALLAACTALAAQDSCKVLIWDNDAGLAPQQDPSIAMDSLNHCLMVWADRRPLKGWDIFCQKYHVTTNYPDSCNIRINAATNDSLGRFQPDIACDTVGNFVVVWQEKTLGSGSSYAIFSRRFNKYLAPRQSNQTSVRGASTMELSFPKVAIDKHTGSYIVIWQEKSGSYTYVYAMVYDKDGNLKTTSGPVLISDNSGCNAEHPDVALNDTLAVFTWADSRDGDFDIYARNYYFDISAAPPLSPRGITYKLNTDGGVRKQDFPCIAMPYANTTGAKRYWVIAWEDSRNYTNDTYSDIYFRQYRPGGTPFGNELKISTISNTGNRRPSVAKGKDSLMFAISWDELTLTSGCKLKVRFHDNHDVLDKAFTINSDSCHGSAVAMDSIAVAVAFFDSTRCAYNKGNIVKQFYDIGSITGKDTLSPNDTNYVIVLDDDLREHGRKVWYHPPKYDNPATSGWNEDPRPAGTPDSLKIPLDSAYVQGILYHNILPSQSFFKVKDTDSLKAYGKQKGSTLNSEQYDVCLMDLGYDNETYSAGTIERAQQESLVAFTDSGGALVCLGNDFGEMYRGTSLFQHFGALYISAGNDSAVGNIDSLGGMDDMFSKGLAYHYPYRHAADNSVDVIGIDSSGCDTLFGGNPAAKWARCCATFYSSYFKGQRASWHRRNMYLPFAMGALVSNNNKSTVAELTRRMLGKQGFNVEPAPIVDLVADTNTSATEGGVILRWSSVCDDSVGRPAKEYLLKIREYNDALPEKGKTTSEQEFLDSGFVYYQTWVPKAVDSAEAETLSLAPGTKYIFSLKAGDIFSATRWSALGSEPMIKSRGDTVTPHRIPFGTAYGMVNHFAVSEMIDIDTTLSDDTLFFTWDSDTIYFGYSNLEWRSKGDLFFYMDTKSLGADSTIGDWNGQTADTAAFFDTHSSFKPDYCLILDSLGDRSKLYRWVKTVGWVETLATYNSSYLSLDTLNNTKHTEVKIPFGMVRYTLGNPFKFLVLNLKETSEGCDHSFPSANPTGTTGPKGEGKAISRYPYYFYVNNLISGLSPRNATAPLAIELAEFSALESGPGVTLSWRTESETDNYQWLIDRSLKSNAEYQRIVTIPGQGSSPTGHTYTYVDNTVLPNLTYYYLLGDQDFQDNVTWHGPVSVTTKVLAITQVSLLPCQPNPAFGSATIRYAIPMAGRVTLKVYDICGRLVRILHDEVQQPGRYAVPWDGLDHNGRKVATGVYFYRLSVAENDLTRKLPYIR